MHNIIATWHYIKYVLPLFYIATNLYNNNMDNADRYLSDLCYPQFPN